MGVPKALVEVAGRTLLELCLTNLRAVPEVTSVVVVHPPDHGDAFRAVVGDAVTLVAGGATRAASVRAGVAAVDGPQELLAIHDAARPLVPPAVVSRTIAAVTADVVAAAPGSPVVDTLKSVRGEDVVGTVGRGGLWAVHTPQVVRRDVYEAAVAVAGDRDTSDDLALVEDAVSVGAVVGRVRLVPGDPRDLKVTYPEDLTVVAAIVRGTTPPEVRP